MKLPQKTLEKKLLKDGYRRVIGVDEVGMGCLAGPVVVCAVKLDKKFFVKKHPKLRGIRDSKLLSPSQRETVANELMSIPNFQFQIAYVYPKTIDRMNIYWATRLAMKRAVVKLANSEQWLVGSVRKDQKNSLLTNHCSLRTVVLVDGKTKIPGLKIEQLAIVKGDRKVFSIACASIIAKVYRDRMMIKYAKEYPEYGFEKHKGYGTKYHQAQLVQFGPCTIHRKSFRLDY